MRELKIVATILSTLFFLALLKQIDSALSAIFLILITLMLIISAKKDPPKPTSEEGKQTINKILKNIK